MLGAGTSKAYDEVHTARKKVAGGIKRKRPAGSA